MRSMNLVGWGCQMGTPCNWMSTYLSIPTSPHSQPQSHGYCRPTLNWGLSAERMRLSQIDSHTGPAYSECSGWRALKINGYSRKTGTRTFDGEEQSTENATVNAETVAESICTLEWRLAWQWVNTLCTTQAEEDGWMDGWEWGRSCWGEGSGWRSTNTQWSSKTFRWFDWAVSTCRWRGMIGLGVGDPSHASQPITTKFALCLSHPYLHLPALSLASSVVSPTINGFYLALSSTSSCSCYFQWHTLPVRGHSGERDSK
jgi:hypothetical protein